MLFHQTVYAMVGLGLGLLCSASAQAERIVLEPMLEAEQVDVEGRTEQVRDRIDYELFQGEWLCVELSSVESRMRSSRPALVLMDEAGQVAQSTRYIIDGNRLAMYYQVPESGRYELLVLDHLSGRDQLILNMEHALPQPYVSWETSLTADSDRAPSNGMYITSMELEITESMEVLLSIHAETYYNVWFSMAREGESSGMRPVPRASNGSSRSEMRRMHLEPGTYTVTYAMNDTPDEAGVPIRVELQSLIEESGDG